jgi:hypothetical protein
MSKIIVMLTVNLMKPGGHGKKPHGSGASISIPLSTYFPMFSSTYVAILLARLLVMIKTIKKIIIH